MNEQAAAWMSAIDGLADVHARMRGVAITARPALDVILAYDGPTTCMYLDPPYPHSTRSAGGYRHEMTIRDHEALLDVIVKCKARVAISTYPNALYENALDGWNRHTFDLPNNAAHGVTKQRELEILYTNW